MSSTRGRWLVFPLPAVACLLLFSRTHIQPSAETAHPVVSAPKVVDGKLSMANQQVFIGGAAVTINLTYPGAAADMGQAYPANGSVAIYSGSTLLLTASTSSSLPLTQNGLTLSALTTGGGPAYLISATLAATASATAQSGLTILANIAGPGGTRGGYDTSGLFDVVAGSPGTNFGTRTASEALTFTPAAARNALSRAARAALVTAFAVAASSTAVTRPGSITTFAPRVATATVVQPAAATRTPASLAPRVAVVSAVSESSPSSAQMFAPQTATETALSASGVRGAAFYTLRGGQASIVFTVSARGGRAAPPGSTAPPIMAFELPVFAAAPSFLAAAPSRSVLTFSPRTASLAVIIEATSLLRRSFAGRAAEESVFTAYGSLSLPITHAPLPGAVDSRDPFVVLLRETLYLLSSLKGNPMALLSTTLAIFDKIAAAYRINELSQAANTLAGLPLLIRGGDGVSSTVYGFGQDQPILALLPAAESLIAGSAPNIILNTQYRGFMSALAGYASGLGFASLDLYLTSLNTPVPYQALVHPNFALLNWLYNAQRGTLLMSPKNVFAPSATFGMATVGAAAGSLVFTHLSDIPSLNVVSQTAGQSTQGYTAAPGVTAQITAAINGTLTCTLIAFGQNAAGQVVTGRRWSAVLDNAAAGTVISFIPVVAGDRLHGITSLSGTSAATNGGFTLASVLERVVT